MLSDLTQKMFLFQDVFGDAKLIKFYFSKLFAFLQVDFDVFDFVFFLLIWT